MQRFFLISRLDIGSHIWLMSRLGCLITWSTQCTNVDSLSSLHLEIFSLLIILALSHCNMCFPSHEYNVKQLQIVRLKDIGDSQATTSLSLGLSQNTVFDRKKIVYSILIYIYIYIILYIIYIYIFGPKP